MKIIYALSLALLASGVIAQRSTQPWSNHKNYKQELLEDIKNTPLPTLQDRPSIVEAKPIQNVSNRVTVGCQDLFLSGINVAWINYGMDVGVNPSSGTEVHPDMVEFEKVFDSAAAAGSNSIRWWMHVNGSCSPQFGANNYVSGINSSLISDTKLILDAAWERGMKVQICLWSFDMLKDQWGADAAMNKLMFSDDDALQAYIDNALIPMVNGLKGHPGLLAWEIFNEPEGMTEQFASGWDGFLQRATMAEIQKFINRCAGAIHRNDPDVIVTNGSWSMYAASDAGTGNKNYYTDAELIAAGGDQDGTLDIYNVHYYSWAGTERSPFHHDFAYWGFDKPTVIAEFHPEDTYGVLNADLSTNLYNAGYAGALDWSWTDVDWAEMKEPVHEVYKLASGVIDIDEFACDDNTTARFTLELNKICQGDSPSFTNITDGADNYLWDFGEGASPATFDGMNPPEVVYSTAGIKTISLAINDGEDIVQKELEVISSESSYSAELTAIYTGDLNDFCGTTETLPFSASLSPTLTLTESVTATPGKSAWDDGATQTNFEVNSNGTVLGIENASEFLLGNWHDWSSDGLTFDVVVGEGATFSFNVPEVNTEFANPILEVSIDGIVALTQTLTVPTMYSVDIPSGRHTISIRNAGDEWARVDEYIFTKVGVALEYEWYVSDILQNETTASAEFEVGSGTEIVAKIITGDIEECVDPYLYTNTIVIDCITDISDEENISILSSSTIGSSFVARNSGQYIVTDASGRVIESLTLQQGDVFGDSWENGIYYVTLESNTIKIIKE